MASTCFKDREGREFNIVITVGAMKRCKALAGVDLYKLVDDKFRKLKELLENLEELCNVVYALVKDQADKMTVTEADGSQRAYTDEDFGNMMAGDTLYYASEAFQEAYLLFYPNPGVRAALRKVFEKAKKAETLALNRANETLDKVTPETMLEDLEKQLKNDN